MGTFIQLSDLQDALSPAVVIQLFDDRNVGVPSPTAVARVIAEAEAEVKSYLVGDYPNPLPGGASTDELLKLAALDFAICLSYERHPKFMRAQGDGTTLKTRFDRATDRMKRIQASIQRPPTLSTLATPANVGGTSVVPTQAIITSNDDGTPNMGDF